MKYIYTVWLRDLSLPEEDQDFEWPACFLIEGTSEVSAQAWGNQVSNQYAKINNQSFVRSTIEIFDKSVLPGVDALPLVYEGEEEPEDKIGW